MKMLNMIDEKIKLDIATFPKLIIDCIKQLEYYNKTNDEEMYLTTLELLETTAKSFVLNNKLSEEDYRIILRKYGGEV